MRSPVDPVESLENGNYRSVNSPLIAVKWTRMRWFAFLCTFDLTSNCLDFFFLLENLPSFFSWKNSAKRLHRRDVYSFFYQSFALLYLSRICDVRLARACVRTQCIKLIELLDLILFNVCRGASFVYLYTRPRGRRLVALSLLENWMTEIDSKHSAEWSREGGASD